MLHKGINMYYKCLSCEGSVPVIIDAVTRMLVNYDETLKTLKEEGKSLEGIHLRIRRNETGEHVISERLDGHTVSLAPGWAIIEWAAVGDKQK